MGIGGNNLWATSILHIFVILDVVNYSDNKGDHIRMLRNIFFLQVSLNILRYGDIFLA